ncbi:MAG: hypothetical protein JXJ04_04180 [Spirochaetales bacterium]|nr:hypothetical protein [Spirochaetales bacterium]
MKIIEACSRDVDNRFRKVITRCKEHYEGTQSDSNEQFNLEAMTDVFEIQELGLLIGTGIKKIKDLGLERLDTVSDAISVAASIVATIVGVAVPPAGVAAAAIAILFGLASDHFSEEEAIIKIFTQDESEAMEQFRDINDAPQEEINAIKRLIKRYINNPSQQLLNGPIIFVVESGIAGFMAGIYKGRLGERPKPT